MTLQGGCQCGVLRYEVRGEPLDLYLCHCLECRHQSASAFGISVIVRSRDFAITAGTPRVYTRKAAVSGTLDCYFCPDCGSRCWHGDPAREETIAVKGGSLDRPPDLSRAKHIWTRRRMPGVTIPEHAETYEEEPPLK